MGIHSPKKNVLQLPFYKYSIFRHEGRYVNNEKNVLKQIGRFCHFLRSVFIEDAGICEHFRSFSWPGRQCWPRTIIFLSHNGRFVDGPKNLTKHTKWHFEIIPFEKPSWHNVRRHYLWTGTNGSRGITKILQISALINVDKVRIATSVYNSLVLMPSKQHNSI